MKMEHSMSEVERIICYEFKNKKLLGQALTHSSFTNSIPYERLEWVGDSAISLALSNYFYLAYPTLEPGQLSSIRAINISTEKFARIAVRHDLYKYIRRNAPSLDVKVQEFIDSVCLEDDLVSYGGVVKAPKVLADIVESIAGAIYVDLNFDLQRFWVIFRGLLEPIFTPENLQGEPQPVSVLFEICQKNGMHVNIRNWRDGSKNVASVYVDGSFIASGSSMQKQIAKLNAAREALIKLPEYLASNIRIPMAIDGLDESFEKGAKRKLHELCHKKKWPKPIYSDEEDLGSSHEKRFVCSVKIDTSYGVFCMHGDGESRKKDAENSAAALMIRALQERNYL